MPIKPPADGNHIVRNGEWVASIAINYGYAEWDKDVWQHGNNAALKEKRKDPHVLAPKDVLYIPPFDPKYEDGATEQKHTFELKVPSEVLRLRLLDPDGKPLKDEEYTLDVKCQAGGGTYKQENKKTNGEGLLKETIPSTAYAATLLIPSISQTLRLQLGFLYPMDENDKPTLIRAAQQRLSWIGFDPGYIDGMESPKTQNALRSFQQFCKDNLDKGDNRISDAGSVDGTLSDKTQKALIKFYGA